MPSEHLLELSMAEGEVTTAEWGGICVAFAELPGSLGGGVKANEAFISTNREKHIKGSEPQRSIVAAGSALVWCALTDATEAAVTCNDGNFAFSC